MNKHVRDIRRLIGAVQLSNVRLVGATVETRVSREEELPKMRVSIGHATRVQRLNDKGRFLVIASIDVKAAADSPGSEALLSISADFELAYQLPSDVEATDAELSTFAEINGVFNAWPYWREFVQTTTARMNLPPLVLPVFRLPVSPRAKKTGERRKAGARERREQRAKVH